MDCHVIPAKAGIHSYLQYLDARLRGHDVDAPHPIYSAPDRYLTQG